MKVIFLCTGVTTHASVADLLGEYANRASRYVPFQVVELQLPSRRGAQPVSRQCEQEGELQLRFLLPSDYVVLLSERGTQFTSLGFANWLQRQLASLSSRRLIFVVGGAYGFSPAMIERANAQISLSSMTFPHQLVRPIFAEQFYRALTILKGLPYHHE